VLWFLVKHGDNFVLPYTYASSEIRTIYPRWHVRLTPHGQYHWLVTNDFNLITLVKNVRKVTGQWLEGRGFL